MVVVVCDVVNRTEWMVALTVKEDAASGSLVSGRRIVYPAVVHDVRCKHSLIRSWLSSSERWMFALTGSGILGSREFGVRKRVTRSECVFMEDGVIR